MEKYIILGIIKGIHFLNIYIIHFVKVETYPRLQYSNQHPICPVQYLTM